MSRKNRPPLVERVIKVAEASLAAQSHVSPVDVLVGIRWLDPGAVERWRRGQIDHLQDAVQTSLPRIADVMEILRSWAAGKGLSATETQYIARTTQRQALQFSTNGEPAIERLFRTHWISPDLSEKKRERLEEKTNRAPELVVVQPLKHEWVCHRCGGTGNLLMMENPGPACLRCVGLDDLEFLAAGNALLTRRAKAKSTRSAVVVRFSRARRRYERQGVLIEPQALADVQRELEVRTQA